MRLLSLQSAGGILSRDGGGRSSGGQSNPNEGDESCPGKDGLSEKDHSNTQNDNFFAWKDYFSDGILGFECACFRR